MSELWRLNVTTGSRSALCESLNARQNACVNDEVAQLAVIEEFKLHREELQERITSLEDEIAQREQVNRAQLEQQDREQVEAKNK